MISLDTNVLVRLVIDDDPRQTRVAAQLIDAADAFVSRTVLLESEWVLRGAYRLSRDVIHSIFSKLMALPRLRFEDPEGTSRALGWYAGGMDFADAQHLAAMGACTELATFDRAFARRALKLAPERAVRAL